MKIQLLKITKNLSEKIIVISSITIIFCLILFSDTSKYLVSDQVIKTNAVNLDVRKYRLFSHKVLIAFNKDSSKIYAVQTNASRDSANKEVIQQITFDKNYKHPLMKEFINLPNNNPMIHEVILDIQYDEAKIYISSLKNELNNNECYFLLLHEYNLNNKGWKEIFKSTPCISLKDFQGVGGRITHNQSSIFVGAGNILFGHKKKNIIKNYEEQINKTNTFGNIIEIDKETYVSTKKSSGHRFTSGLFYDSHRGILWETEHGPRGGDELNKIESGYDYGWPNVSYGLVYNKQKNKDSWIENSHENFKKPFFSWTPSIGISQVGVIGSQGKLFEIWGKNDLIVSSLKNKSIYRLRVEDNKVFYSEKIYIGERIRSLIVLNDVILISTDDGSIITIQKSKVPIMTGAF